MANDHLLNLPKPIWAIKIVQASLAVLLLPLSAYQLHVVAWSGDGMMLFSCLYSLITLTYYFVSLHHLQNLYNWIALLVLESLAVVFWLCSWALLAALFGGSAGGAGYSWYYGSTWTNPWDADNDPWDDYYRKRSLSKRSDGGSYSGVVAASLAFGLIQWILYCVTLGFMAHAVYRHRKTKRPLSPTNRSSPNKVEGQAV